VNTYYHSHIDPTRKAQEGARGALVVVMDEKKGDFVNPPTGPDEDGGRKTRRHRMAVLEAPSVGAQVGGKEKKRRREREMPFVPV